MRFFTTLLFSALIGLFAHTAKAYTPESGFWIVPTEPGSGIAIEIQDNYVFLAAYVYDAAGNPTWFTAQGLLTGNSEFHSTATANDGSQLSRFINGQCIGCVWRAPSFQGAAAGNIDLFFNLNNEARAQLRWGGRTLDLHRFDFYLTRTGGIDPQTEKMRGEWQVGIDFFDAGGSYTAFPFQGDVWVVDAVVTAPTPDIFEGCRPTTSLDGFCSSAAFAAHDLAGFYTNPGTAANGNSVFGNHTVIVKDSAANGNNPARYLAYYVRVGTDQFDGVVQIYNAGTTPGAGPFYPVRGFRSASRRFVDSGTGPSEAGPKSATPNRGMIEKITGADGRLPSGMTRAEVAKRYAFDWEKNFAGVIQLVDHLEKNPR